MLAKQDLAKYLIFKTEDNVPAGMLSGKNMKKIFVLHP
jgi:hypothetical protein